MPFVAVFSPVRRTLDHARGGTSSALHGCRRNTEEEGTMTTERQQTIERLGSMISTIRIAMLTTVTDDGAFRSRPITTHGARFDGDLWFFTRVDAAKLDQLGQHRRVGVSYASPADNIYVSLSGTARISMDPAKARELWDP